MPVTRYQGKAGVVNLPWVVYDIRNYDFYLMLPWSTSGVSDTQDFVDAVRTTSLSKLVRDDLLGQILRGELPAGARINEPDVATRLGVSRVPVREALRELESSGLVVARKHAGVFV